MSITLALGKESMDGDGKEASYSCYIPCGKFVSVDDGTS
jgi:hypothetical protein